MVEDVVDLATRFAQVMAVDRPAVRLERITGDACKRFHADSMRVRLITTYRGAGTEWLSAEDGVRIVEGRPPAGASVHALDAGHVAMMKGRLVAPDHPLIHRSPPIRDTGRDRLVLVIDEPMARH